MTKKREGKEAGIPVPDVGCYIIPILALAAVLAFAAFKNAGMHSMEAYALPTWFPSTSVCIFIWLVAYSSIMIAAIAIWMKGKGKPLLMAVMTFLLLSVLLSALWSYLVFVRHEFVLGMVDMLLMAASTLFALVVAWKTYRARITAAFLAIFAGWGLFAAYFSSVMQSLS